MWTRRSWLPTRLSAWSEIPALAASRANRESERAACTSRLATTGLCTVKHITWLTGRTSEMTAIFFWPLWNSLRS